MEDKKCCWDIAVYNKDDKRPPTDNDRRIAIPNQPCGRKATHRSRYAQYFCNMHSIPGDINLEEELKVVASMQIPYKDEENITFPTGAQRCTKVAGESDVPLRYDLIPTGPLRRLAARYGMGAVKYGDNNYKKGIPTGNILNHVIAHLEKFREGNLNDDDLAGAAWGIFTLMYFQQHGNPAEEKKDANN